MSDNNRKQVLSYGGGVNTAAMCVLVAEGRLPRPDIIVIADTGREATATWDYLNEVMQPYLGSVGLHVDIAPHSLAEVDLYSKQGLIEMPMYTTKSGELGKLPTFCSTEWKQRVVNRWLKRIKKVKQCDQWIGYTLDEIERAKPSGLKWAQRTFPLLDLMLTRSDCKRILDRAGLPVPPHSACWMCPHRNNAEWRFLRDEYPDDWQAALTLEQEVRESDPHLWLHEDAVPLDQADLDQPDEEKHTQCGLGMCYV